MDKHLEYRVSNNLTRHESSSSGNYRLVVKLASQGADFVASQQSPSGAWSMLPAPRILENALVVCALQEQLPTETALAKRWLLSEARIQTHHPLAACADRWLLGLATSDGFGAQPLDLNADEFDDPAFSHRRLVLAAVAFALGRPVLGADRDTMLARCVEKLTTAAALEQKAWTAAEYAAIILLLARPTLDAVPMPLILETIDRAQSPNGSIAENTVSTTLVSFGLSRWKLSSEVLDRCLDYLKKHQSVGTWRFASAEVWDTALMLRTLKGCQFVESATTGRAVDFLVEQQNTDGGFPYRAGVESDTDTTAMAVLGLPIEERLSLVKAKAQSYLLSRKRDGLWRTWHFKDDPPAEDVVAHAVLALKALGVAPEEYRVANDWLRSRVEPEGWRAHWYNMRAYAAHEVGLALGREILATRYVCDQLLRNQNRDGGWGAEGAESTAAATGIALALLSQYLPTENEQVGRGLRFLENSQSAEGAFVGPTNMYAPRPFAIDYPMQTHALSLLGPVSFLQKRSPMSERRSSPRAPANYTNVSWNEVYSG